MPSKVEIALNTFFKSAKFINERVDNPLIRKIAAPAILIGLLSFLYISWKQRSNEGEVGILIKLLYITAGIILSSLLAILIYSFI